MPLTDPEPFQEALDKLEQRIPTARPWNYATWAAQAIDVRERAFFSAKVENAFFLKRAKLFIQNFLERQQDEDGKLKAGSMARFVEDLRAFAIREGMGLDGIPPALVDEESLLDVRSEARLRLIFKTNVATSYGFGSWKQGMEPVVLEAFPAARVVRNPGAKEKRPRHEQEEGNVRLKTDREYWADYMNGSDIGGFQTPWPPYGFNSHIDQADVSRSEAERLQLIQKDKPIKGSRRKQPTLNDRLRASLAGLDAKERAELKAEMGSLAVLGPKFIRMLPSDQRPNSEAA